jgi:hypothetical protein
MQNTTFKSQPRQENEENKNEENNIFLKKCQYLHDPEP